MIGVVDDSIDSATFGQWVTDESRGEKLSDFQTEALHADPLRWDSHLGAICRDINLQMEACSDPDAVARMRRAQWAYIKRKADVKVLVRQMSQTRRLAVLEKNYATTVSILNQIDGFLDDDNLDDEALFDKIAELVDDWKAARQESIDRRKAREEDSDES